MNNFTHTLSKRTDKKKQFFPVLNWLGTDTCPELNFSHAKDVTHIWFLHFCCPCRSLLFLHKHLEYCETLTRLGADTIPMAVTGQEEL